MTWQASRRFSGTQAKIVDLFLWENWGMASQSHSTVDLAKTRIAHRYAALKADLAEVFRVLPHLHFGSAVSPAMPDGIQEAIVRPGRRQYRTAATPKKTVSRRTKKPAARAARPRASKRA